MAYHKYQEQLVDILVSKTQSKNKHFFRLLVAYHFAQAASMMRAEIHTKERGVIPVNLYCLNLAVSGFGKNFSLNILENSIMDGFKHSFLTDLFPTIAGGNLREIANDRAIRDDITEEEALAKVHSEFDSLGVLAFNFDSGTVPAIKQLRQKLLMAKAGSVNFVCDEVGSNLIGNTEVLTAFLELYDVGEIKQKLIKNTKENVRSEEVPGSTPTNALLFGTPDKLLDGGKIEEALDDFFSTGFARRLLFGYTPDDEKPAGQTAEELYDALTDNSLCKSVEEAKWYFTSLASTNNFASKIDVSKEVTIELLGYKLDCEERSKEFSPHEDVRKAEMIHRYFKVLKTAGAYAFVDKEREISSKNLKSAIKLVEDSGRHFEKIQEREGSYVRLAKYIATMKKEVTQVDLIENLPFFRGTEAHKRQLMTLAVAYGYKNNIIIKRSMVDDIEFYKGESLEETDLEKMIISHSLHITENYSNVKAPFSELCNLTQLDGRHFVAHHLKAGYRDSEHIIEGFNMCILDVDDGIQMHTVESLMSDFEYLIYTTKRNTDRKNRFRVMLPLSHVVKLDESDYKSFMSSIYDWLPFEVDNQTNDRPRKWLTNDGKYSYNKGKLLDATRFIPRTDKSIKQMKTITDSHDMSNLQRWFLLNANDGNRSNIFIRYGLALLDSGKSVTDIGLMLHDFNSKLPDPIKPKEIDSTCMLTIMKRSNK